MFDVRRIREQAAQHSTLNAEGIPQFDAAAARNRGGLRRGALDQD
jgi:hypothetical protein